LPSTREASLNAAGTNSTAERPASADEVAERLGRILGVSVELGGAAERSGHLQQGVGVVLVQVLDRAPGAATDGVVWLHGGDPSASIRVT